MRGDDLFVQPPKSKPKTVLLLAGSGFVHSSDECFILADGVESLPHARVAEQLTRETALWGYTMIRQRQAFWKDKKLLVKRIFRSTNLRLWQKRRDPGFDAGLASALAVLLTINETFWLGTAGNFNSFLYRDGLIDILTKRDVDEEGMLTKAVGFGRKQLIPAARMEKFLEGDIILLATDSVANYVSEDQMRAIFEKVGTTNESLQSAVDQLIETAKSSGSTDTMSLCMVKRIISS